jgi:zinc and cadmium transporter
MSTTGWLTIYCGLVLIASIFGGCLPFLGKVTHSRLQFYLSASAGVMLGASFFHVMPEAMEMSKGYFGWWMSLGVVGLFCIERFIAPHSHELDGDKHAAGGEHAHHHHHEHDHGHFASADEVKDHRAAAPAVAGWMAVLGLTIHTFMNGVGLAGLVQADMDKAADAYVSLPGLAMFLAIVLHKPADALAISMVLSRKNVSRPVLTAVQLGFAVMVPVGAAAFMWTRGAIEADMRGQLTGAALAFSAGTFLFIALSDLLPEVQFHRHDRVPLFLTLAAGVALMGGIALLEGHDENGGHSHAAHGQPNHHHDKDADHDHDHDSDHDHDHMSEHK